MTRSWTLTGPLLGTVTLEATADCAFDELVVLDRRRRALLADRGVDPATRPDPDADRAAWG